MSVAELKIDVPQTPLPPEIARELRLIARDFCDEEGGCHGPDHSLRVEETALFIGAKMGARQDIIQPAAILHDIGRRYETASQGAICHADKGTEMAREILNKLSFCEADNEAICHAIATHRFRGQNIPKSIEAHILFDADKLDSIGAIGIGRAFLFAGQIGARLHNGSRNLTGTKSYSTEDTAYREFKVKMCKVKNRMLTPVGKQLAQERHDFMEIFFNRLETEIFGR